MIPGFVEETLYMQYDLVRRLQYVLEGSKRQEPTRMPSIYEAMDICSEMARMLNNCIVELRTGRVAPYLQPDNMNVAAMEVEQLRYDEAVERMRRLRNDDDPFITSATITNIVPDPPKKKKPKPKVVAKSEAKPKPKKKEAPIIPGGYDVE